MSATTSEVIRDHRNAGRFLTVGSLQTFCRDEGDSTADPVVLIHGLPTSSFLYRKVAPRLASRGLRAVAFDLPGLGLTDRPEDLDYSLHGLGAFAAAAVDALELDAYHLVVHDAGGPIGFELALRQRERIRSLTITNTVVELEGAHFPGEALARAVRRVPSWLSSEAVWRFMMYAVGVADRNAVSDAEIDAYRQLALGNDDGAGYLRIMRGLGAHRRSPADYTAVINTAHAPYPIQLVWGMDDPILRLRKFGRQALRATGLPSLHALPARHFLHEDHPAAISDLVARFVERATTRP